MGKTSQNMAQTLSWFLPYLLHDFPGAMNNNQEGSHVVDPMNYQRSHPPFLSFPIFSSFSKFGPIILYIWIVWLWAVMNRMTLYVHCPLQLP